MQSTKVFRERLDRLKSALGVEEDQDAAEALGMSKQALSARKKREAFPAKELRALAQRRPELRLDVDYVLTGATHHMRAVDSAAETGAYGRAALEALKQDENGGREPEKPRPPSRNDLALGTRLDPLWPQVMEWVYDDLNERKRRMPNGGKFRDLVDAVMALLRLEDGAPDRETVHRKIDAIL
jgi:CI repressor-like protein